MPAVFAAPILPGKTDAWKAATAEILGARSAEYEESRSRMGITRECVSLQQTPDGDFVIVYLEGEDPDGLVGRYLNSDHPCDRWFPETVLGGIHGMDASEGPPPPNQIYLDWTA